MAAGSGYPTQWSEESNILWKVPVPGWGTSTPVVWGERIFLTGEENSENLLICLDRADGGKKWQVALGQSAGNRNQKASGSNPSPIADGSNVYAYYRSGDLACVDFEGKTVWRTNLQQMHGPDNLLWDLGTSPVLAGNLLIVAVVHQGPSYLLALDKKTGHEVWKQPRMTTAPGESRDSYTTPLVLDEAGEMTVVLVGADFVTGHAAATGKEVWRFGTLNPERRANYRSIASPVIAGDKVIVPYSRGATLTAIRLGGVGDVSKSHQAWQKPNVAADVPSPAVHDGKAYLCGDRGDIVCVDVDSGAVLWTERLPRNRYPFSASPVIADGKLYATRKDGTTFALSLGDKPALIATNALRENTYSTPVLLDGKVFLRTSEFLFCIGR